MKEIQKKKINIFGFNEALNNLKKIINVNEEGTENFIPIFKSIERQLLMLNEKNIK